MSSLKNRRNSNLKRPRSESLDSDGEAVPSTSRSQLHERKTSERIKDKSNRLPSQNSVPEVVEFSPSAEKSRIEEDLASKLGCVAIPLLNVEPACSPKSRRFNSLRTSYNERNR